MIVVVTGAAGSIGSSVVRHLAGGSDVSVVRAVDVNESGLHALHDACPQVRPILANVVDDAAMRLAFRGADVVVHCAALKHVGVCEYNPDQAVTINTVGTGVALKAADDVGVKRFVLLSTDKASQPTGVMAATKLLAERLLPAYGRWRDVETCAIRFGNVFYSRGSVVPTWVKRAGAGEPIQITHRDATRFSVTIDQAVLAIDRLMFRAIESGSTYVMPMKSYDLGLLADVFAAVHCGPTVEEIGLRPGEKMHEILLSPEEALRAKPDGEFWATNPQWPSREDTLSARWSSEDAERLQIEDLRRMISRYVK